MVLPDTPLIALLTPAGAPVTDQTSGPAFCELIVSVAALAVPSCEIVIVFGVTDAEIGGCWVVPPPPPPPLLLPPPPHPVRIAAKKSKHDTTKARIFVSIGAKMPKRILCRYSCMLKITL
jgi:hypothetical protein